MTEEIGARIKELIDYLNITYNAFARECGINNATIKLIITGETKTVSIKNLERIRNRYPVRNQWLIMNSGDMWEIDYFKKRYEEMKKRHDLPSQKINALVDIFETSLSGFAHNIGVGRETIVRISEGLTKSISPELQQKIRDRFPYIEKDFFE